MPDERFWLLMKTDSLGSGLTPITSSQHMVALLLHRVNSLFGNLELDGLALSYLGFCGASIVIRDNLRVEFSDLGLLLTRCHLLGYFNSQLLRVIIFPNSYIVVDVTHPIDLSSLTAFHLSFGLLKSSDIIV